MLQGPVPALEPPIARPDRGVTAKWRVSLWTEPQRLMDLNAAAALRPYERDGLLAFMTERPVELRASTVRRLTAVELAECRSITSSLASIPRTGSGGSPARCVRRSSSRMTSGAEFLATYGYETMLVDDRYNRGPIRSINLMRIARPDLARVIALRLEPELAEPNRRPKERSHPPNGRVTPPAALAFTQAGW